MIAQLPPNRFAATKFDRVAPHYLKNAQIQQAPAQAIIDLIDNYYHGDYVLDLGSGPGTLAHQKQLNYPYVGLDLSLAMLRQAQTPYRINADATNLPLASASFGLIISNLMLQWPTNKLQVIREVWRSLKPGGSIILTSLIEPSLHQLQSAWREVDNQPHTLNFLTSAQYCELFLRAGFSLRESRTWQQTVYFPELRELLAHFRASGTNLAHAQQHGLGGRQRLRKLTAAYESQRTSQGLALSYAYFLAVFSKN